MSRRRPRQQHGRVPGSTRRAKGLTLVAGLVFTAVALISLGVLASGLWWQFVRIAAPIALVVFGVVGIAWSQQRTRRRPNPTRGRRRDRHPYP